MRRISDASVYHGFRGQLPNELPSDELSRSLLLNRLQGVGSCASDGSTFEQYLARKKKTDPPPKKFETLLKTSSTSTSTSTSYQDARSNAFLALYGIDPADIRPTATPSGVSPECARMRSFMTNPDRDTILLPPSDLDAKMYDILTPKCLKEISYTIIEYDNCVETYTEDDTNEVLIAAFQQTSEREEKAKIILEPELPVASISPPVDTHISEEIDEGYNSSSSVSEPRGCSPGKRTSVQVKTWYTGRKIRCCRKSSLRLFVKLRRRAHRRKGVHCLCSERYPRDIASAQKANRRCLL